MFALPSLPPRRPLPTLLVLVCGVGLTLAADAAGAGDYPNRPIRIVVPFAAGTQLDLTGRIVAAKLAEAVGQPVVVDNRPGASGNIGSETVAKAAPDGYTLLLTGSFITILPSTIGARAVDPIAAFAPISKISEPPMMIVVNPALNVQTLDELIALARKAPGKIAYSTPGVGSSQHLAAIMLQQRTGIELLHVPYTNGGQALNDVVSGIVPVYFSFIGAVESFLRSGQLRALAVATAKRATNWPDVPTVAELGYKDFAVSSWNCVLAPAGTPPEIIERLHGELARIVQQPDVRAQFLTMGSEAMSSTPEQFGAELKAAVVRWSDVARLAGMRVE
ncbi:MAG TPA: tripartite tricarboxylate transporter substrate binding protein [Casimicrobiaceae bacterium]|jgi:tripartite-type tricarboxylate transporter receptor subunit TctC|nr:tripartite tricarboxylate transporter substrate binding protein [Casimicrobiaceae bacterium]